jgi:ketosteroid isomerase-like protein
MAANTAAQNRRDVEAFMQAMSDSGVVLVEDTTVTVERPAHMRDWLRRRWSAPWLRRYHVTDDIRRIDVLTPDVALITVASTVENDSAGTAAVRHLFWTGAWQNTGGRWVLVQQH